MLCGGGSCYRISNAMTNKALIVIKKRCFFDTGVRLRFVRGTCFNDVENEKDRLNMLVIALEMR